MRRDPEGMAIPVTQDEGPYPDEILERCLAIQAGWTPEQRLSRIADPKIRRQMMASELPEAEDYNAPRERIE